MENLRKGVYIQESIHEVAYWERRKTIEKKSFEHALSVLKEQEEQSGRTPDIVTIDSEQNNHVWKGLTLTSKEARHDQSNRRKRKEKRNRLVILETIQEGSDEEDYSGETSTERYTRYRQACRIVVKVEEEQQPTSDEKEYHDRKHREKTTNKITNVDVDEDSDSDSDRDWTELFCNTGEDAESSEDEEEPQRQLWVIGNKDKVHHMRDRDREPVHRKNDYFDWTPQLENRLTHNSNKVNLTPHMDEEYEELRTPPADGKQG